jgi:formamidopyrimidine-DNA glycosylase
MPELPEVEIQRRLLTNATAGTLLNRVERLDTARFEGDPTLLAGLTISAWQRRGKYLIAECGSHALLSHLGMTGQWIVDAAPGRAHARVVLHFDNGKTATLIDPRRFGWTWIVPSHALAAHPRLSVLGLDPLDPTLTPDALREAVGVRRTALKNRLMDQRVIAGLGNIALSEIGWRARVHPHLPCREVSLDAWPRLIDAMREHIAYVLDIEDGDEIVYLGYEGAVNPFVCYGRLDEPCPRCQSTFDKGVLAGRATYWCPSCQPPPRT